MANDEHVAMLKKGAAARNAWRKANPFIHSDLRGADLSDARPLQELGWTSGRNIQFTYRWERGDAERMGVYAAELMDLAPDVVLAATTSALAAVRRKTRTVPKTVRRMFAFQRCPL
jgi:hypothetical protein